MTNPKPQVTAVDVVGKTGQFVLVFDRSPFGADSTRSLTVVTRHVTPDEGVQLLPELGVLLQHLASGGHILAAAVVAYPDDALSAAYLRVDMSGAESDAELVTLYERMIPVLNALNFRTGVETTMDSVANQMAELTGIDSADRVHYNAALDRVREGVRTKMMHAFNRALARNA